MDLYRCGCIWSIDDDDYEETEVEIYDNNETRKVKAYKCDDNMTYNNADIYILQEKIECDYSQIFDDFFTLYTYYDNDDRSYQRYYFRYGENIPFRIDVNMIERSYDNGMNIIGVSYTDEFTRNGFINIEGYYHPKITLSKYFHDTKKADFYIPEYLNKFCNTGYVTEEEALKFPNDSYFTIVKNSERFMKTKSARK